MKHGNRHLRQVAETNGQRAWSANSRVAFHRLGYLREAYHGEPYATQYLCAEVFESEAAQAYVPAPTLRERLAKTLELAEERERTIYKSPAEDIERVKQNYRDFVALCERKEEETGQPVLIIGSY